MKLIQIPASKSIIQRVVAAALLANSKTTIKNFTECDDTAAALRLAQSLGANIQREKDICIIKGGLKAIDTNLYAGESGLSLRMFTPIAALTGNSLTISGKGSLLKRPIGMITEMLKQNGLTCKTNDGLLPINISGKLKNGNFQVDGSTTSQLLTGLLMALPVLDGNSTIIVENLNSKPYIDITLDILKDFGISIQNNDYEKFVIQGNQNYKACDYEVEGDWSSAAFWLVAGAIAGDCLVSGLKPDSKQADRSILDALKLANCKVLYNDGIFLSRKSDIATFEFDAINCPDLIPVLTLLATCTNGISKIHGAQRLQYKESDRAAVLIQEFAKLGITIKQNCDVLEITGGKIGGGSIDSHNDHRIAMTFAIASLVSDGNIVINNQTCVNKSYPNFFRHFAYFTSY